MDDLQLVRSFRADAPAAAPGRARDGLLDEQRPARRSKTGWLVSGAAVLALVAGAVALQSGPGAEPSSAAAVLNHAADVVAADDDPRPSDQQWFYRTGYGGWMHFVDQEGPAEMTKGEGWFTFDGTKYGEVSSDAPDDVFVGTIEPEIVAENVTPAEFYDAMAALPEDPDALLSSLRDGDLVRERGSTTAEKNFDAVVEALANEPIPASARANLYRALATIPGVGIDETAEADLLGRPVLAVTFGDSGEHLGVESRREVLLDPTTFDYLGDRIIALEPGRLLEGASAVDVVAGETYWETASTAAVAVMGPGVRP